MKVMPCGDYVVTVEVSRDDSACDKKWCAHWAIYSQSPWGDCKPIAVGNVDHCALAEEADRYARVQAYWAGEALREKCAQAMPNMALHG